MPSLYILKIDNHYQVVIEVRTVTVIGDECSCNGFARVEKLGRWRGYGDSLKGPRIYHEFLGFWRFGIGEPIDPSNVEPSIRSCGIRHFQ